MADDYLNSNRYDYDLQDWEDEYDDEQADESLLRGEVEADHAARHDEWESYFLPEGFPWLSDDTREQLRRDIPEG